MGTYIHTYKKTLNKKATLDGEKVVVGFATYLCKATHSGYYTPSENREMIRATNLSKKDQADYIVFDGDSVYKNNKFGVWHDGNGFWSGIDYKKDFVGTLKKVGRSFVIVK
ncbi:MAG: hypothetical protein ACXACC_10765 [Promethearchaeota archaeon]|jgi:hypothetical protein